ncbi:MAG: hypothetical protein PUP92_27445 [Rhizonema sp. PD38]|nr:hypothetical protein [Rhizonema sp. PD38]
MLTAYQHIGIEDDAQQKLLLGLQQLVQLLRGHAIPSSFRRSCVAEIHYGSRPRLAVFLKISHRHDDHAVSLVAFNNYRVALRKIAVRATGSFNISAKNALIQGISHRFCKIIQRKDGYGYAC